MPDTIPFSDREKDTLQRFGFPTHSIYSRGVAEKDDVTSMGMPFYKYRVFKNPNSYILTKRKYSSERERPIGDEERVGKSDNLESLLNRSQLSESNINKNTMKLTESKLRNIIREELSQLTERTTADDVLQDIKFELEQNMGYSNIKQVESSGRIKDGDMGARLILPQGTTVRVDIGGVLMVDAASRQELQDIKQAAKNTRNYQVIEEGINELSFREDKMRELLTREPKLDRIRQESGHSLQRMFNQYVKRNKELKRRYKQASPTR
jgi:hypothetical protein